MAIVEVPTSSATRRRVSALGPSMAISRAAAAINAARCCGLSVRFVLDADSIGVLYQDYNDAIDVFTTYRSAGRAPKPDRSDPRAGRGVLRGGPVGGVGTGARTARP